jgi:hypothetical protein
MNRLIRIFQSPEMHMSSRLAILDTFLIIAKQISLRPIFLRDNTLILFMNHANKVLDMQKSGSKPSRYIDLNINCVKLLCMLSTVKTTRYYIPGETNIAERLRKYAFDVGIFSLLVNMHNELSNKHQTYIDLKTHIK